MGEAARKLELPVCPECGTQEWDLSGFVIRTLGMHEGEPAILSEWSTYCHEILCGHCYFNAEEDRDLLDKLFGYWFPM